MIIGPSKWKNTHEILYSIDSAFIERTMDLYIYKYNSNSITASVEGHLSV